jgi:predicted alpha/beta-fold hydrolase
MIKNPLEMRLFCGGMWAILSWQASASDIWHIEGDPRVVAQEIQFTNGDAHLAGTVYFPESGDHLPAVVALHGASDATRKAAVYRHLRQGLPAMGVAVLVYDRRGTGASSIIRCNFSISANLSDFLFIGVVAHLCGFKRGILFIWSA